MRNGKGLTPICTDGRRFFSGIEGLRDGENMLLAETADQFLAQLNQLLGSASAKLERLAVEGRALYEARYSRKVAANSLERIVKTLDQGG